MHGVEAQQVGVGLDRAEVVDGDELQVVLNLKEKLAERVIGQDEAITAVANAIRRTRAGLSDPSRPTVSIFSKTMSRISRSVLRVCSRSGKAMLS